MDQEHPRWDEYQEKFEALSFLADLVTVPPAIGDCRYYLCLVGENGLTPDEEFEMLLAMESAIGDNLKKVVIETGYWQDTVLFVP